MTQSSRTTRRLAVAAFAVFMISGPAAAQAAAQAAPDGYTLYMTQASTWTVLPIQQEGKMPIDLFKAFTPISLVGTQPIAVSVNPQLGVNTVPELIAKIK